jgi:hypothetical protein
MGFMEKGQLSLNFRAVRFPPIRCNGVLRPGANIALKPLLAIETGRVVSTRQRLIGGTLWAILYGAGTADESAQ